MSFVLELGRVINGKDQTDTFSIESIEFVPGFVLSQTKDGIIEGIPSFTIARLRIIQEDNGEVQNNSGTK